MAVSTSTLESKALGVGQAIELSARKGRPLIRKNMPELDAIRGGAILMVVLYHGLFWSSKGVRVGPAGNLFLRITQPGWLGVDLFFVLSGFLITGVLFDRRCNSSDLKSFYIRRALRILPLYYAALVLICALMYCVSGQTYLGFFGFGLIYLANLAPFVGRATCYPLGVLWSLSVEEHFYLFWPAVVRFLSTRWLYIALVCLISLEPIARWMRFRVDGDPKEAIYYLSWFRLDSFAWGALVALIARTCSQRRELFMRSNIVMASIGVAVAAVGFSHGVATRTAPLGAALQFSCIDSVFAGLIGTAVFLGSGPLENVLARPVLCYLGKISYCLYLIHQTVFWLFDRLLASLHPQPASPVTTLFDLMCRAIVVLGIAIGVSELSRRFFESRFLAMKGRLAPSQ
jgi:peptidoglycan/LPS O-acetylase OafA/YrhL